MNTGENLSTLVERYKANLERKIEQGNWSLVCKDEEMAKDVELRLSKGAAQDTHCPLGLDPLSVIETSLKAFPKRSGHISLEKLANAFEVLELAALNLYLCPWRKEYRVVKTFSGMFTHCVKPAFTSQQVQELFGLLGYQTAYNGEEEELKLGSKPVQANSLIQLACAFFTARTECRLLLSTVSSLYGKMGWELQLVQERKHGHSLQIALESTKRKLKSDVQSIGHDLTDPDQDALDIYTDTVKPGGQIEPNHMTAPPSPSYIPPEETSQSHTTQSSRENEENVGKKSGLCVSALTYQISPVTKLPPTQSNLRSLKMQENEKQVLDKSPICTCKTYDFYARKCDQCREIHNAACPCFKRCTDQGHSHRLAEESVTAKAMKDHILHDTGKPTKDTLRKHGCMNSSANDIFYVCHNCHLIHDFQCNDLQQCHNSAHNVARTGRLQQPHAQSGATASPERHTCLTLDNKVYVVCSTCNQSHDCICKKIDSCNNEGHNLSYLELFKEKIPVASAPFYLHECCNSCAQADYTCFSCKVIHTFACDKERCVGHHDVQFVKKYCSRCSKPDTYILCKYCFAFCCQNCWIESPVYCKCGMTFSTSV